MPTCERHALRTISVHQSYHGWPTVARRHGGELLVVSSAGRERHVCPFGQVHLIRSTDNGETWSGPELLANGPLDDRDAGMIETSRGTLLVNWFTSIAWLRQLEAFETQEGAAFKQRTEADRRSEDGFIARCRKIRALLTENVIERELGTWVIRSTDGGQSWSEKIDCGVGSPHGPTELDNGRLLFVGNARAEPQTDGRRGSPYGPELAALESRDDGCSWRRIGTIPARPGDEPGHTAYCEPHAVQAADGRIVVHIRHQTQPDAGFILQSESADGGRTFSVPHNTGLEGLPAHLLRMADGRLLTTYGFRGQPAGNRAAVSDDGGRTWSAPLILDQKDEPRDLGYPSSVVLADGEILSVWYERLPGDDLASLQAARWSLR